MPDRIRPFVVGTGGHIDHGKTALVERITDADPDRLPEEQERDLTIDLGFAEYVMPDGSEVGIIDVPGHERFIRNMVAGATSMDFAILVVAADDGVMPQTREHLQILDLLGIERGIPVITKIDLVENVLVEVVEDELTDLVEDTFLEDAPVSRVSSETGEGYDEFIDRFEYLVEQTPERKPEGIFRMPVQRSFTVKGLGTVVTGVPVTGSVEKNHELEVQPDGPLGRVRGIQAHHRDIETAVAGHRTALNLAEVHHEEVERGDLVCTPGYIEPGSVVDAEFTFSVSDQDPIEHWDPIRIHVGSDEVTGRIVPLEDTLISPGEQMLVQFDLNRPVAAVPGDPFILRKQSPMITLGGGTILKTLDERVTRSNTEYIRSLKQASRFVGEWTERAQWKASEFGTVPFDLQDLARSCYVRPEEMNDWFQKQGIDELGWVTAGEGEYLSEEGFEQACSIVEEELTTFHDENPVLVGIQKHDLQNRTDLAPDVMESVLSHLQETGTVVMEHGCVRRADHDPSLPERLERTRERFEEFLLEAPYQTPSRDELLERTPEISEEELSALIRHMKQKQEIVEPEENIFFHTSAIEDAKDLVRKRIKKTGSVETGEFRDELDTSRKYAIPLLEYFDQIGLTYRRENSRYLVEENGENELETSESCHEPGG